MPLKLARALKREVDIGGVTHTVTISPLGVRLVRKGFRKGVAVSWRRLLALAAEGGDRGPGIGGQEAEPLRPPPLHTPPVPDP